MRLTCLRRCDEAKAGRGTRLLSTQHSYALVDVPIRCAPLASDAEEVRGGEALRSRFSWAIRGMLEERAGGESTENRDDGQKLPRLPLWHMFEIVRQPPWKKYSNSQSTACGSFLEGDVLRRVTLGLLEACRSREAASFAVT